jgi:phospholipase/carboxylesterase
VSALDELTFRERGSDGGDGALVLFHGRGADENDLYPLLDMFDPERRLAGVCPRGPLSLPPGGAHWYSVMQVGYPDPATFHPTYSLVTAWLDEWLASKDVTPDRTVLAGFSQGCVMTYSLGLGRARPRPAGLIGLSGFIPTVEEFEIDLNGLDGYPVAIGHGIYDPVIEVAWGRDANQRLSAAGADITYRESPMDHTIDPAFIPTLATWLTKVLP